MKKRVSAWILASTLGLTAVCTHAGPIELKEYAFNVDGVFTTSFDPDPTGVDLSLFNTTSGLGIITAIISGEGEHFFGSWFDHEITQPIDTPFNETGVAHGSLADGQYWEIDEPGFGSNRDGSAGVPYFGDIYWNIENSTPDMVYLDNQVFYDWVDDQTLSPPDDVSMAMGWEFFLGANQQATIELVLSDRNTNDVIFFYGSLDVGTGPVGDFFLSQRTIPEPSIILLFGAGLLGLGGICRRRRTA